MKHVLILLEDKEYNLLLKKKGKKQTWREYLMRDVND